MHLGRGRGLGPEWSSREGFWGYMLRSDRGISRDVGESRLAGFGFARMRSGESESLVDCDVIEEFLAVGEARWFWHGSSGSERGLQAQVVSDLVVRRLGERGLRA